MSSLVRVSRIDQVSDPPTGSASGAAPLYVGNRLFYPNLGEPIRKSAATELPFFFTLYGTSHIDRAAVQLLRNGQSIAEGPLDLGQANGPRIQHVGRLPITALPPGTYELRIRVFDGTRELSRTAFFTLQD
jgi:hypothetical protein